MVKINIDEVAEQFSVHIGLRLLKAEEAEVNLYFKILVIQIGKGKLFLYFP